MNSMTTIAMADSVLVKMSFPTLTKCQGQATHVKMTTLKKGCVPESHSNHLPTQQRQSGIPWNCNGFGHKLSPIWESLHASCWS